MTRRSAEGGTARGHEEVMDPQQLRPPGGPRAVLAAWCVHAYTATGVVLAMLIVMAAWTGDVERALWLGLAALVVDGTDGMLARGLEVKRNVPGFDGALLDNIVDYLTYAFVPMVLLWTNGYLGDGFWATVLAVLPLVASAYQFCGVNAKTSDHLFLGFPSYWNVVAFYVVVFDLSLAVVAALLVTCAVLVFVPVGYVYPSRTETLRPLTLVLTTGWLLSYAFLLAGLPSPSRAWAVVSLAYVAYYVALSLYLTLRRRSHTRSVVDAASHESLA
jgi:phosphatidylcholine synthase